LQLEANATLVLTDFGSVQEETCIMKAPCVTLRDNTERKNNLVILESTVPPRTCDKLLIPLLEKSGLKVSDDFFLHTAQKEPYPGILFLRWCITPLHNLGMKQQTPSIYQHSILHISHVKR
jgi:hypothetical protein